MKSTIIFALLGTTAQQVAAHSIFQQLWVDGADMISYPSKLQVPRSNSPVTSVGSTDMRCNVWGSRGVGGKCPVPAGGIVTIEMHAVSLTNNFPSQPGDRSCNNEAIGGAHYGPVMVYLSKVSNAATADGSSPWFKVFED
ncbi:hypothetical protein MGG_16080, partial [Pyricularia oryzae 70-15]